MQYYKDYTTRKKTSSPLKEVFEELLQTYKLKDRFNERKVITSWEELMGKTVASRTTGLSIKDKKLYVKLSSSAIKNELIMNRSKVMALIDEKFGKGTILELIFQ